MARSYHIDIAQDVVDADKKWVDNLLSHFHISGVESARRGVPRRISTDGIYRIALIRQLTQQLGLGAAASVSLAGHLLESPEGQLSFPFGLDLRLDRAFQIDIDRRIDSAVESVTPVRRGRPTRR
ncbi:MAG TPA: hypothetical protein VK636_11760 [Gemmatimonadaceae bacterium]|nr:hypothetical protein [Gemmatimonadaceae bacterium]